MSEIICKYCQSTNTRKYGKVEGVQTYFCNDCGRKFKADNRLFRMKTPYQHVASALDDYYKGKSINDIRDSLNVHYGNYPSSKTVYNWIQKYTNEISERFRNHKPNVGDVWIADETVLEIDGKNVWMYDIIDEKTRFLLATQITKSRTTKDAEMLMRKASKVAGKVPKTVITDYQNSYLDGIELAYGSDSEHIQGKPFSKENDTQLIERFHSTLKERTKVMRGLKSIDTANQFMDGFIAYYNYMRPHETLDGKTPAEEAGIEYKAKSWADVIRYAHPQIQVLVTPAQTDILSERQLVIRPIERRTYDTGKRQVQRKLHRNATRRILKRNPRITQPMPQLGEIK